VSDDLSLGDTVRVRHADRRGHHRIPGYCRGAVGRVVAVGPASPLPDDVVARAGDPRMQCVYTVRFQAASMLGEGDHEIIIDLWREYLVGPLGSEEGVPRG
jgi:Nitrile hydratase beta subunit